MATPVARPLKQLVHKTLRRFGREIEYDIVGNRGWRLRRHRDLSRDHWGACQTILGRAPRVIFDVGANIGQTSIELARRFPHAEIHAFEPTPDVFRQLRRNVSHLPRVHCHQVALGDRDGLAALHINRFDQTNSLLATAPAGAPFCEWAGALETVQTVEVPVRTAASFAAEAGLEIDILKTDAQGYDLNIIEGAGGLAIPLIFAEVCFAPFYEGQPTFGEFHDRVNALGYRLVWLYEACFKAYYFQTSCNALFMREDGRRSPGR